MANLVGRDGDAIALVVIILEVPLANYIVGIGPESGNYAPFCRCQEGCIPLFHIGSDKVVGLAICSILGVELALSASQRILLVANHLSATSTQVDDLERYIFHYFLTQCNLRVVAHSVADHGEITAKGFQKVR